MKPGAIQFALGVVFIVGLALYMDKHRAEDQDERDGSHHPAA